MGPAAQNEVIQLKLFEGHVVLANASIEGRKF